MKRAANPQHFGQPSLQDLTIRFLAHRSDAALAAVESAAESEVELHEVAVGFRVDPKAAWADANAALTSASASPSNAGPPPADWGTLVAQPTAVASQPFALGHFPQRVKDLQALLTRFNHLESRPRPADASIPGLSGLRNHFHQLAETDQPEARLRAAGLARSSGDLKAAEELLVKAERLCQGQLRPVWENEKAALLWQQGRGDEALAVWQAQAETPMTAFNRGMALLFLGRAAEARGFLANAASAIPEASGWNALARLYLALAELHS